MLLCMYLLFNACGPARKNTSPLGISDPPIMDPREKKVEMM